MIGRKLEGPRFKPSLDQSDFGTVGKKSFFFFNNISLLLFLIRIIVIIITIILLLTVVIVIINAVKTAIPDKFSYIPIRIFLLYLLALI